MEDINKHNILYFESDTYKGLYRTLNEYQNINKKRFLSLDIKNIDNKYCCIVLTNPTEVIIVDGNYNLDGTQARVQDGYLRTSISTFKNNLIK